MQKFFKSFGPAFLILALGIGSGEFILWPYLSANYGFGILWGALLGISLQLFLINLISRNTLILGQNILISFSKVFSWALFWIIFSTIIGFGWPGFASLSSELLIKGLGLSESFILPMAIFLLVLAGGILIFAKSAYRRILFLEKIGMSLLFLLVIFLFIYYFNWQSFKEMILGFFGFGQDYFLFSKEILVGGLATFLAAVAYAGSGGNLLLANSFYLEEEKKGERESDLMNNLKRSKKNNLIFFWGGGLLIIGMLSYISEVLLKGGSDLKEDFSFLIKEAEIFSTDIAPWVGGLFVILGAFALFGVQMGIFDFLGRLAKNAKNSSKKWRNKISDHGAYSLVISIIVIFGLIIFSLGYSQPKFLIVTGAVLNAFSMGVIALLLLLLEIKKIPEKFKRKWIIFALIFASIFYFSFFLYVLIDKIF